MSPAEIEFALGQYVREAFKALNAQILLLSEATYLERQPVEKVALAHAICQDKLRATLGLQHQGQANGKGNGKATPQGRNGHSHRAAAVALDPFHGQDDAA